MTVDQQPTSSQWNIYTIYTACVCMYCMLLDYSTEYCTAPFFMRSRIIYLTVENHSRSGACCCRWSTSKRDQRFSWYSILISYTVIQRQIYWYYALSCVNTVVQILYCVVETTWLNLPPIRSRSARFQRQGREHGTWHCAITYVNTLSSRKEHSESIDWTASTGQAKVKRHHWHLTQQKHPWWATNTTVAI